MTIQNICGMYLLQHAMHRSSVLHQDALLVATYCFAYAYQLQVQSVHLRPKS